MRNDPEDLKLSISRGAKIFMTDYAGSAEGGRVPIHPVEWTVDFTLGFSASDANICSPDNAFPNYSTGLKRG